MRLQDRVALITGGAQGIGRACAERFLAEGARVVIVDVNAEAGEATARDLDAGGQRMRFVHADLARKAECVRAVEATIAAFGRIDILLNNAAIIHRAAFLDLEEEDLDRVLAINLKAGLFTAQAAARGMIAQGGGGVIINMSSVNAVLVIKEQVAYNLSKGAVNQLTRSLSLNLAEHGIRVCGIGPGTIMTEMARRSTVTDAAATRNLLSRTPLGRFGEPSEIAGIAAFLASDDASYITGETIYADGGRLPLNYTVPVPE